MRGEGSRHQCLDLLVYLLHNLGKKNAYNNYIYTIIQKETNLNTASITYFKSLKIEMCFTYNHTKYQKCS